MIRANRITRIASRIARATKCETIERQKLSRGTFCLAASRCLSRPSGKGTYHGRHKHYRPDKILSELFPAILDRIITGKYSKRINLIVIRAHYRNHLAVHRSHDTRTEIPSTKPCNELPDENSPTINSVIFDRNITGENSQRINLVMISVTIVNINFLLWLTPRWP